MGSGADGSVIWTICVYKRHSNQCHCSSSLVVRHSCLLYTKMLKILFGATLASWTDARRPESFHGLTWSEIQRLVLCTKFDFWCLISSWRWALQSSFQLVWSCRWNHCACPHYIIPSDTCRPQLIASRCCKTKYKWMFHGRWYMISTFKRKSLFRWLCPFLEVRLRHLTLIFWFQLSTVRESDELSSVFFVSVNSVQGVGSGL